MKKNTLNNVVVLRTEVEFEGEIIKQLTLREPKVKDMMTAQTSNTATNDAEIEIQMMSNLTDKPQACIEELSMFDYSALQRVYQSFLIEAPARPKI